MRDNQQLIIIHVLHRYYCVLGVAAKRGIKPRGALAGKIYFGEHQSLKAKFAAELIPISQKAKITPPDARRIAKGLQYG